MVVANRLALTLLVAAACAHQPTAARPSAPAVSDKSAPADSQASAVVQFSYTILYLPEPTTKPVEALTALREGSEERWADLDPSDSGGGVAAIGYAVFVPDEDEIPNRRALSFFGRGLSESETDAVQQSKLGLSLYFAAPRKTLLADHARAHRLVGDLVEQTGGLIWDPETREMFSKGAWRKRGDGVSVASPSISSFITTHAYRDGDFARIVTLGMAKLGLPDVGVNRVPLGFAVKMQATIHVLCQLLLEGARPEEGALVVDVNAVRSSYFRSGLLAFTEGAEQRITLAVRDVEPEEGDADNAQLEITFSGPDETLHERQGAMLSQLWGRGGEVFMAAADDEELARARAKAVRELLALKPRFLQGVPAGERLLVKAPFETTSGGPEWMWVEVVRWRGRRIHGVLLNTPIDVPGLTEGAEVIVEEGKVFDYMHTDANGTERGNETTDILQRRR